MPNQNSNNFYVILIKANIVSFLLTAILILISSFGEVLSIGLLAPVIALAIDREKFLFFLNSIGLNGALEDIVSKLDSSAIILVFMVVASASFLLRFVATFTKNKLAQTAREKFIRVLIQNYFREGTTDGIAESLKISPAELVTNLIHRTHSISNHVILPSLEILNAIILLTLFLLSGIAIFGLALIKYCLIGGVFLLFLNLFFGRESMKRGAFVDTLDRESIGWASVFPNIIKELRVSERHPFVVKSFIAVINRLSRERALLTTINASPRLALEFFAILICVVWIFANSKVLTEPHFLPLFFSVVLAMQRALPLLNQTIASTALIKSGQKAILELERFFELFPNRVEAEACEANEIESLTIPQQETLLQNGITLSIQDEVDIIPSGLIVIAGTSGVGKSTFLDAFLGVDSVFRLALKFNGRAISASEAQQVLWGNVNYVSQVSAIFPGTIADNLLSFVDYGSRNDGRIKIKEMLIAVGLLEATATEEEFEEFISRKVVPGATNFGLSGGQLQRICLLRAIINKSKIICLDEPTAQLDIDTEALIIELLAKLSVMRTIIVISHSEKFTQLDGAKVLRLIPSGPKMIRLKVDN